MGVDLVASIQRALLTYANILEFKGEKNLALTYRERATRYRSALETQWWNDGSQSYYAYYNSNKQFGNDEGDTFLLWFDVLTNNKRLQQALDRIAAGSWNVENTSYLPYLFYKNGRWEKAKEYIRFLTDPSTKRREYPEVSYGVIDGIVHGLMGVNPSASTNTLSTLLRDEGNDQYKVDGLHLLQTIVTIEHMGPGKSIVTNSGDKGFTWKPAFTGAHAFASVNGKKVRMKQSMEAGKAFSYLSIYVKPGATITASL